MSNYAEQFARYVRARSCQPVFFCGDAVDVLRQLPDESIDFCMTSPPYWNKRDYHLPGIGLEATCEQYIQNLLKVFHEIRRTLKAAGSFWLNVGDTYRNKGLVGIPWRLALALAGGQGWVLRNDVVWNKIKGPDNSRDKLRNTHEYVFHFVKDPKHFYYDVDAIRSRPREARVRNGAVVSATGVTGVRYKRQIELSTSLTPAEKSAALSELRATLDKITRGELSDFRMIIRRQQRTTHSDSARVSGRAKELAQKGFYILRYHPAGGKPGDVWDIMPEDAVRKDEHYAAYPEDLCKIPMLATCPEGGIALDPFCGTGTTNLVASRLRRKSVGIDLSPRYIESAERRCRVS